MLYTGQKWPNNNCLGWRERDKTTGAWGPYIWMDYETVQKKRANIGAGLSYLHAIHGVSLSRMGGLGTLVAKVGRERLPRSNMVLAYGHKIVRNGRLPIWQPCPNRFIPLVSTKRWDQRPRSILSTMPSFALLFAA